MKTLIICSGGLASATLAHMVAAEHPLTHRVSFDNGQCHKKALDSAQACAVGLSVSHNVVNISAVGRSRPDRR